ncbi:Crp/Fnr family transcriptional regulator [Oceanicella sp. SM1341]|uniref:Crp/Fnr family transcriptional regulator n=1 Tax=Oceanicella sp. SM1341 TaxID=1548889 RepID=UPI000E526258|nr:Crp/Fnr family transcriptional regulator [Oceanicella sp. SM1341]
MMTSPCKTPAVGDRQLHLVQAGAGPGCAECPARHLGLCDALSDAALARLAASVQPGSFAAGHSFWQEDGQASFVAVLRSGYLRMLRYSAEGRREIVGLAGPGALVGEAEGGHGGYALEAVTGASLCRVERSRFRELMAADRELRRGVCLRYAERLEALRRHIWSRGLLTPEERLCGFLVLASAFLPYQPLAGGGGVLTIEFRRADIADLLGTTKETVSRSLQHLQAQGLIRLRDARHVLIPEPARLARRGGLDGAAPAGAPAQYL